MQICDSLIESYYSGYCMDAVNDPVNPVAMIDRWHAKLIQIELRGVLCGLRFVEPSLCDLHWGHAHLCDTHRTYLVRPLPTTRLLRHA